MWKKGGIRQPPAGTFARVIGGLSSQPQDRRTGTGLCQCSGVQKMLSICTGTQARPLHTPSLRQRKETHPAWRASPAAVILIAKPEERHPASWHDGAKRMLVEFKCIPMRRDYDTTLGMRINAALVEGQQILKRGWHIKEKMEDEEQNWKGRKSGLPRGFKRSHAIPHYRVGLPFSG